MVASLLSTVQRTLGWRLLRAPLGQIGSDLDVSFWRRQETRVPFRVRKVAAASLQRSRLFTNEAIVRRDTRAQSLRVRFLGGVLEAMLPYWEECWRSRALPELAWSATALRSLAEYYDAIGSLS